jgi:hypothetical protein
MISSKETFKGVKIDVENENEVEELKKLYE